MTPGEGLSDVDLARSREIAFRAARAAGASRDDADDVAQMTMVRLLAHWDSGGVKRARRSIGSTAEPEWERFVRVVAKRIWVDAKRKDARRRSTEMRSNDRSAEDGDRTGPKLRRPRPVGVQNPVEQEVVLALALVAEIDVMADDYWASFARAWLVEGSGVAELAQGVAWSRSRRSIYRDRERLREYFHARDLISCPAGSPARA